MGRNSRKAALTAAMIICVSGCTTTGRMFDRGQAEIERAHRLMELASRYDQNGQTQAAIRIYEQVLIQQPENTIAQERREVLVQRAVEAHHLASRPDLRSRTGSSAVPTAIASRQVEPSPPVPTPATLEKREIELVTATQSAPPVDQNASTPSDLTSSHSAPRSSLPPARAVEAEVVPTTEYIVPDVAWAAPVPVSHPPERPQDVGLLATCKGLDPYLRMLVSQLNSSIPSTKIRNLDQLAERGVRGLNATPAIQILLDDTDPFVRLHAARALYKISGNPERTLQVYTSSLQNPDHQVIVLSAYFLGEMGPHGESAMDALAELQSSTDGLVKLHVAEAISKISPQNKIASEILAAAVISPDSELRWLAVMMLSGLGPSDEEWACDLLNEALDDPDPSVKCAACLGLGGMPHYGRIALDRLRREAASNDAEVKGAAEIALLCLGSQIQKGGLYSARF